MTAGAFVWYELMTPDVDAAQAFYAQVVGWSFADAGMPDLRYALASSGERQVAGIMGVPSNGSGMPGQWFGYIAVDDVDDGAARVQANGGRVHRLPTDIPGVGRFAVVADPQGATFMLFRGEGTPQPVLDRNTPGLIGWHELQTSDWESALAFYQALFGWEKAYAHDMGPMGVYQTFSVSGAWTGGMMTNTAEPPRWLYYFSVADIDAAAGRIASAGGTVLHGPHPVPGDTWVVAARDPQGVAFALVGPHLSGASPQT